YKKVPDNLLKARDLQGGSFSFGLAGEDPLSEKKVPWNHRPEDGVPFLRSAKKWTDPAPLMQGSWSRISDNDPEAGVRHRSDAVRICALIGHIENWLKPY